MKLDTIGPPETVSLKLADGDWQAVPVDGNNYEIKVNGPYIVAVTCNDVADLFDTYMFARTPEDDVELSAPCTGEGPPLDGLITGTSVQPAEIAVGFSRTRTFEANETFEIAAAAGPHDLIAVSETAIANMMRGIVIQRDLTVAGNTSLAAPLDLAQGMALVPTAFTITTDADESTFAFAQLITAHNTLAFFSGDPSGIQLAPASALIATDRQQVTLSASRGDLTRQVSLLDTRPSAVELPPHLDGVAMDETAGTITASWGELPVHDQLSLTVEQFFDDTGLKFHDLEISPAYADEMGTEIALDLAIPGFDPAAAIITTDVYTRSFAASSNRGDQTASSRLAQEVNAPVDAKPRRRSNPKRR